MDKRADKQTGWSEKLKEMPVEEVGRLIEAATLDRQLFGELAEAADAVRQQYYQNRVFARGLIEFTSYCRNDCLYCGLRRVNATAERYRLGREAIVAACREGYQLGYRSFVLQGGEDGYYTTRRLTAIIDTIKGEFPDCALTLSLGERSRADYAEFRRAGADRYLLRHETASPGLYARLHPDMSWDNRRRCLDDLRQLGYQVGAGFMVGLPGQTCSDLAADVEFIRRLQPEMVGIGPFIPHRGTPLAGQPAGGLGQTLVMVAVVRLVLPKSLLPATTAVGTIAGDGRERAVMAGANVVMPNLTPLAERKKYMLYDGKICVNDSASHCRGCIEGRLKRVGFVLDLQRGDHCDWRRERAAG
ncbi:MAG: [FeFe] hydrogenase H-cluster radical SAM maturase HydE [Negativicutes bacterium]|nr:[FeFe] hydrogenase H-cluster radical SAM maturase HydE [Negativicutes bacterium]